jgi:sarcosine oxidase gamma subunit
MTAKKKNPNAVALGRRGGEARAERLSPDELSVIGKKGAEARLKNLGGSERQQIAVKAALARWAKAKKKGAK